MYFELFKILSIYHIIFKVNLLLELQVQDDSPKVICVFLSLQEVQHLHQPKGLCPTPGSLWYLLANHHHTVKPTFHVQGKGPKRTRAFFLSIDRHSNSTRYYWINELWLCRIPLKYMTENNSGLPFLMVLWAGCMVLLVFPGITHGLIKLEGCLGRKVHDDLTHLPGVHGQGDLLVHLGSLLVG